ncbi:unnamed protein product [Phaedon cochleariae]|uniref:C-type lectin domain-containing protein n=1 Tax=Phaedon cochleariae TaxID=80249 RepID=A0A9N9SDD6_PHACE|nr:unnamed protein product [Phaedon cochleariae]
METVHRIYKYLIIASYFSYWQCVNGADDANGWGYPSKILPLDKFGNKSYYFVHSFKATFLEANQFCQDVHMRLLSVTSREENTFLYNKVQEYKKDDVYWTSGTRLVDGNDYIWLSIGEPLKYKNFHVNQPDNPNDYCLRLWLTRNVDLQFDDTACYFSLYFICEREDNQVDQPNKINQNWENIFEDISTAPDVKLFSYKNKSYYVNHYFEATYLQAVQFCQLVDMELLSIESADENTMLYQEIRSSMAGNKFWSSGTRLIDDNNWYWLPTGNKINYYNWQASRPVKTSDRKCIQLNQDINNGLFWSDEKCDGKSYFICQTSTKNIRTRNCPISPTGNSCPVQPTTPSATVVPSPHPSTVREKKYYFGTERLTYNEAIKSCQDKSMQLVSIQNKEQNDAINTQLQQSNISGSYWTSGNRIADKQTWYWLNNEKITYFNWAPGEPNNRKENEYCIEISRSISDSKWNDDPCEKNNFYICESWIETPGQGQCSGSSPVVNIYVNNNIVTANGTVFDSNRISTTSNTKPGNGLEVNNNIIEPGIAPVAATTKLPVKTKVNHGIYREHSTKHNKN